MHGRDLGARDAHGIPRHAMLSFFNNSVMGSDFHALQDAGLRQSRLRGDFTPPLLRKDLELGLKAARQHNVPMP